MGLFNQNLVMLFLKTKKAHKTITRFSVFIDSLRVTMNVFNHLFEAFT